MSLTSMQETGQLLLSYMSRNCVSFLWDTKRTCDEKTVNELLYETPERILLEGLRKVEHLRKRNS